jgi:hypothetical protein
LQLVLFVIEYGHCPFEFMTRKRNTKVNEYNLTFGNDLIYFMISYFKNLPN